MSTLLCYCGNVHAARDLGELLHSLATGPALVRQALGVERLSYGLWMSQATLAESAAEQHHQLRAALDTHHLDVWTMNAFPLGDFHAPVVKHKVYRPHWGQDERLEYTLQAAELLALLLPSEVSLGSISTLPIGYRSDFASAEQRASAMDRLRRAAEGLARIEQRSGKHIRLCLEPEPGCVLETGKDALQCFEELGHQDQELVAHHLGLCLDTCHHALAFEDPGELVTCLLDAGITIGKVQLSSAAELDPGDPLARAQLATLNEPRFLHQVRAIDEFGCISGCDDLNQVDSLEQATRWRVHYHLPIYKKNFGALQTTQDFLKDTIAALPGGEQNTHFEVETYTWGVLPDEERPGTPQALATCIANELRFAEKELF